MPAIKTSIKANRERAREVFKRLDAYYKDAHCTLNFENPLQLLIGTILAAQCTDERVNIVTKGLFQKYKTAQDFVEVPQEVLEEEIRTCGFYRNKARNIKKACAAILERFNGEVPGTMEELLSLDGVGRKTANVILGECFNTPAIIVDTHCTRINQRLGFTKHTDAVKIEQDLMKIWPREHWTKFSHCMVFHGRSICQARSPKCSQCPVRDLCPFPDSREGRQIAK